MVWPGMLTHATTWELYHGVTNCFLTTISLLALIGIRYPVRMLPLLLFEMTWKVIWLLAIGLPLYLAHRVDGDTRETIFNCLMGVVIVPLVIPWGYVYAKYLAAKGDRWR